MTEYYRPLLCRSYPRPAAALICAGGNAWFQFVEKITREGGSEVVGANSLPSEWKNKLTRPRPNFCGMDFFHANIMGILNVTPDSFSDGGAFL
ncbi:MAG: dihydropteroate synthase, partial [Euryarchaeota archaeon]|nr:dihydropteroate synthase [Euryarchaeota archaeon]